MEIWGASVHRGGWADFCASDESIGCNGYGASVT